MGFYVTLCRHLTEITTIAPIRHIMYDYSHIRTNVLGKRKENFNMSKKEEIINRIAALTDKQFEMLIALYSQQGQEFVQDGQSEHPSFLQPSA